MNTFTHIYTHPFLIAYDGNIVVSYRNTWKEREEERVLQIFEYILYTQNMKWQTLNFGIRNT